MAKKNDVVVDGKPVSARKAHGKNASRFAAAVKAEAKAHKEAEGGEQLARLAAFDAMAELSAAKKANDETAAAVEQEDASAN